MHYAKANMECIMHARFNPRLPVNMKTIGSARIWQLSFERFVQEVDLGFGDGVFLLRTLMTLLLVVLKLMMNMQ